MIRKIGIGGCAFRWEFPLILFSILFLRNGKNPKLCELENEVNGDDVNMMGFLHLQAQSHREYHLKPIKKYNFI